MSKLFTLIVLIIFPLMVSADSKNASLSSFDDIKIFKNKDLKLVDVKDLGDLYHLVFIVGSNSNIKAQDAFVSKDKKVVVLGKAYDAISGDILSLPVDLDKYREQINMSVYEDDAAFKVGTGKDIYYVFTDPECVFCKKFEANIEALSKHVTINYYFHPLSFHKNAKAMSLYVLDQQETKRHDALKRIMFEGSEEYKGVVVSDAASLKMKRHFEIAKDLGVSSTPKVFTSDGKNVSWPSLLKKYNIKEPVDMGGVDFLKKKKAAIAIGEGKKELSVFSDIDTAELKTLLTSSQYEKLKKGYTFNFFIGFNQEKEKAKLKTLLLYTSEKASELLQRFGVGDSLTKKEENLAVSLLKQESELLAKPLMIGMVKYKMGLEGEFVILDGSGKKIDINRLLEIK
jgi:thiol:disulfide interchange protein DsbC